MGDPESPMCHGSLPCALTWVQLRLLPPLIQPPPPAQTSPATGTEKSTPTLGTATGTTGAATQMATVPTTHRSLTVGMMYSTPTILLVLTPAYLETTSSANNVFDPSSLTFQ